MCSRRQTQAIPQEMAAITPEPETLAREEAIEPRRAATKRKIPNLIPVNLGSGPGVALQA